MDGEKAPAFRFVFLGFCWVLQTLDDVCFVFFDVLSFLFNGVRGKTCDVRCGFIEFDVCFWGDCQCVLWMQPVFMSLMLFLFFYCLLFYLWLCLRVLKQIQSLARSTKRGCQKLDVWLRRQICYLFLTTFRFL